MRRKSTVTYRMMDEDDIEAVEVKAYSDNSSWLGENDLPDYKGDKMVSDSEPIELLEGKLIEE